MDDDSPILDRPGRFRPRHAAACKFAHSGTAINKRAGVGRILHDRRYRTDRRSCPPQITMPVAARNVETSMVEQPHDLGHGAEFQEIWNTNSSRSWTAMSGSLTTTPLGSRRRPIGKESASSPRSALARRPAVRRLRILCSSSSDIVPFNPRSSRPLALPGHRRHLGRR